MVHYKEYLKVALVCIVKNEDKYIDEWIQYNLKLGFTHIFIYTNNWKYENDNPQVTIIEFNGDTMQLPAYNSFIEKYKDEYDWAAMFDCDEFLVLKKHNNISDFICDYINKPGICVNWVLFGDNNISSINGNYSVLSRFTKRQKKVNEHIKSIINLKFQSRFYTPHSVISGCYSTDNELIIGPYNFNGNDNVAQLNHYFCKTIDEFKDKINRGRSDTVLKEHQRTLVDFERHNFNEEDDFLAFDFYNKA